MESRMRLRSTGVAATSEVIQASGIEPSFSVCFIERAFAPGWRRLRKADDAPSSQYHRAISSSCERRSPVVCVIRPSLKTGEMERLLYRHNLSLRVSEYHSSGYLGGVAGAVFGWRNFADLFEDSAKICRVTITTAVSNFFECHAVVLQHKLGPVHADEVHVVIEPHESFLPKQAGNVVGR